MGLVPDATGAFHAVWSDNRTGLAQMWTAAIRAEGTASEGGLPELADAHDVSALVSVRYAHPRFDPATNRVTVEATVTNVSDSAIAGPLKVRAIALESRFGQVTAIGAENGRTRVNAVWDLNLQMDGAVLCPSQSTRPRTLTFALSRAPVLRRNAIRGSEGNLSLVSVTTRVYGKGVRAKS